MHPVYAALVHYPVVDRTGQVIAAALTNLDLHDLARLARTYGMGGVYVVTPLEDQQEFARRIVSHWTTGPGAEHIPDRRRPCNSCGSSLRSRMPPRMSEPARGDARG